jgi:hypothetical protein
MKIVKAFLSVLILLSVSVVKFHAGISNDLIQETQTEIAPQESWMGVYMNGIKVGYIHSKEFTIKKDGKSYIQNIEKSWMKVSRLGGNPVEMSTIQETLYNTNKDPVEIIVRTKMSESETLIKAEIMPDKIIFKAGEDVVKELPYEEKFYVALPLDEIMEKGAFKAGERMNFKLLDIVSYSLSDCLFEVLEKEDVLILGKKLNLQHVKTKITSFMTLEIEEWIDAKGKTWKSVSDTGFLSTTAIAMPEEKALEISDKNFDIAFSSLLVSNVTFKDPLKVKKVTFKISGISEEQINRIPGDGSGQKITDIKENSALVHTSSLIFREDNAVSFPVTDEKFQKFIEPTFFCQSDDPGIKKVAGDIVGEENNSWRASKKIAEWVVENMKPNYDVGFASAREIFKNMEGDCSEYTVLMCALCRAAGIPARANVGIMYGQGIFAYHMWPEVYVGEWVALDSRWLAVDEESGEYYTDATHIVFGRSLLDENIFKEIGQSVSEIIGKLKLEVIDFK